MCNDSSTHPKQIVPTPPPPKASVPTDITPSMCVAQSVDRSGSACLLAADESILMLTAVAEVFSGKLSEKVRVLFDSGSQYTYVTQSLIDRLSAKPHDTTNLTIARFQSKRPKSVSFPAVDLGIRCSDGHVRNVTALAVPTITCPIYRAQIRQSDKVLLNGLQLADPLQTDTDMSIDILVGLTHYWDFIDGVIRRLDNGIVAVSSSLGWLLSGTVADANKSGSSSIVGSFFVNAAKCNLDEQLRRLWDLESLGITDNPDPAIDTVLSEFNTTSKLIDNRYHVHFPWKDVSFTSRLPDNRLLALKRLQSTQRRLQKNPLFLRDYDAIIVDQEKRGFIERVDESLPPDGIVHYIPHHPVIKQSSTTTKVRIVYDASARVNQSSQCLNDVMYEGPNLMGDLLLRFRVHKVALYSDIEKAFLQVALFHEDRDCTRFFWYDKPADPDAKRIVFRSTRVPFGVVSSPFLLNATVKLHLSQSASYFASRLHESMYVDNSIISLPNPAAAVEFYHNSKSSLLTAGMNLREWSCNIPEVVDEFADADRGNRELIKILGLSWDIQSDELFIPAPHSSSVNPFTKRYILHFVSKVFDPLGFVSPVVIRGKILIQNLWLQQLRWDDPIPDGLASEWKSIQSELEKVSEIRVPRWHGITSVDRSSFVIHAFADASPSAYAAVVYVREIRFNGQISVHFITSKARVAPTKSHTLTLPRLELMGIVLASRLINNVKKCLQIES